MLDEYKDTLILIGLCILCFSAFYLITNPMWLPGWIAEPLFTGITHALEEAHRAVPSEQVPLQTPTSEEADSYSLYGTASSGNLTFNFTATLEPENGIQELQGI